MWFQLKNFYNLSRFLAYMIRLTMRSVMVLLPGKLSILLIILASAFHLSRKFSALE